MVEVVNYGHGYAVSLNGEYVLSSSHKPFSSETKAWGFVKIMKFIKKDPAYQNADIPYQYLENSYKPSSYKAAPSSSSPRREVQCYTPSTTPQPTAYCDRSTDDCRPLAVSAAENGDILKVYNIVTSRFSHAQVACLSTLLFRFDQAWSMNEQIDILHKKDESYDRRTKQWKCNPQPAATTIEAAHQQQPNIEEDIEAELS